jgi:predicted anti-sigma-YlaC factor YlaD
MLFDAIVDPISDLSTLAAQSAVEYIADHSSLRRAGWILMAVRVLVAGVVFIVIGVGGAALVVGLIWWVGLKLLFS